jgi:hypothetical protein
LIWQKILIHTLYKTYLNKLYYKSIISTQKAMLRMESSISAYPRRQPLEKQGFPKKKSMAGRFAPDIQKFG